MNKIKSKILAAILASCAIFPASAEVLKFNMSEYAHGKTGNNIYIGLSSNFKNLGFDEKDANWTFEVLNKERAEDYSFDEYGVFRGYVTLIPKVEGMYNIKATLKAGEQAASDTIKVLVDNEQWERKGAGRIKERTQKNDRDKDYIIDEFDKFPDKKATVASSSDRTNNFFTITFSDPEIVTKGDLLRIYGSKYSPKREENIVILESEGQIFNIIPEKTTSHNVWFKYPFAKNARVGVSVGDELVWLEGWVNAVPSKTPLIDIERKRILPSESFWIRGRNLTKENTVVYYDNKELLPIEFSEKGMKLKIDNLSDSRTLQLKLSSGESKKIDFEVMRPFKVKISDNIKDIVKEKDMSIDDIEVGFGLLFMKKYKESEGVTVPKMTNEYQELMLTAENKSSVFVTTVIIAPSEEEVLVDQFSSGVTSVLSSLNIKNVLLEENFIMAREMASDLPAVRKLAVHLNQSDMEDFENIFKDKERIKKQIEAISEFNGAMMDKLKSGEYQLNPKVNFEGYLKHVEKTKKGLKWMMSR